MKTNMKKRKIFEDAVDLMTGEVSGADGVRLIPIDDICAYHEHPFRLYEGERLSNMVESIEMHGVLTPVIVRRMASEKGDREDRGKCKYEMLAGHNRMNAAKLAGLKDIPAIVKEGLSEDEAYIYVIETNVIQRSFAELLPSEKAAVMSEHYQRICGRMRRDEILRELQFLKDKRNTWDKDDGGVLSVESPVRESESDGENITNCRGEDVGGHNGHGNLPDESTAMQYQVRTRDIVAEEYGFSSRNAARYLRINYLIQPFKDMIDDNRMALLAAVDISYLNEAEQGLVWDFVSRKGISLKPKTAKELRKLSGKLTAKSIEDLCEAPKKRTLGMAIRINGDIREKYFAGMSNVEVMEVIGQALEAWFKGRKTA